MKSTFVIKAATAAIVILIGTAALLPTAAKAGTAQKTISHEPTSRIVMADKTEKERNQHFFSLAILFLGVGEFAGLLGRGVSQIKQEQRKERRQKKQQEIKNAVLTYEEYISGRYKEKYMALAVERE